MAMTIPYYARRGRAALAALCAGLAILLRVTSAASGRAADGVKFLDLMAAMVEDAEPAEVIEIEEEIGKSEDDEVWPFRLPVGPAFQDEGLVRFLDISLDRTGVDWDVEWILLDYRLMHFCRRGVKAQHNSLSMTRHDFGFHTPVIQRHVLWTTTMKYRRLDISGGARLPHTGGKLPAHLQDIQLGTRFIAPPLPMMFDVTMGSPSDRPFDSGDEVTADITGIFGGPPFGDDWSFLFLLNFANNREFWNRKLLPGFQLRYKPDETFRMVAGFPYSGFRWAATDRLSVSAEHSFPRTVHSQVAFHFTERLKLYGGFDWTNQRYLRHDRVRDHHRLFYYEKRLTAGVRWDIGKHFYVDVFCGWGLDRMFFEGTRYENRSFNRIDIADGPFAGVQLGLRF